MVEDQCNIVQQQQQHKKKKKQRRICRPGEHAWLWCCYLLGRMEEQDAERQHRD